MSNKQLIGKKFDLDLGSLAPVSMIVKDVTKDKVSIRKPISIWSPRPKRFSNRKLSITRSN
jgi:hypothetical protein